MKILLMLMMVVIGMTLPIQAGMNARLREVLDSSFLAAIVNFLVGLAVLGMFWMISIAAGWMSMPQLNRISQAPWWALMGGIFGASVVFGSLFAVKPLGAAVLIACLVLGQMIASVLADHHGWVGYSVRTTSGWRILGFVLLVAGVILLQHTRVVAAVE